MDYKLIWKTIDKEITKEEEVVLDQMMQDSKFREAFDQAQETNDLLMRHYNPAMDAGFLSKLKVYVSEELDLPDISFNFTPVLLFVLSALIIVLFYFVTPILPKYEIDMNLNSIVPYISVLGALCLGGLTLLGIDQVMCKRLKTKNLI